MSHPSIGPGVEQADLSAISPRQGPSAPPSVLASSRAVCMFVCVCGGVACAYACCVSSYYINPSSTAWQLCYDAVDIRCDLMRSSCVYGVSVQSDDTARARGGASDPTRHDGDPKRHARKHAAPTPHSTSRMTARHPLRETHHPPGVSGHVRNRKILIQKALPKTRARAPTYQMGHHKLYHVPPSSGFTGGLGVPPSAPRLARSQKPGRNREPCCRRLPGRPPGARPSRPEAPSRRGDEVLAGCRPQLAHGPGPAQADV